MNLTLEEKARVTEPSTYILMEAAMCAWEHLLKTHEDFEDFNGAGLPAVPTTQVNAMLKDFPDSVVVS